MDKINFENLPSTNTPLDADTLNGMQSNIEKSVVAVGKTQPSTGENVWIKRGKNLFDGDFRQGTHVSSSTANRITNLNSIKSIAGQRYTFSANLPSGYQIKIMNCSSNDLNATVLNDTDYTTSSVTVYCGSNGYLKVLVKKTNDGNITPSEVSNYNFQIEQNSTATTYEPYVEKEILVKNSNGVFEEFLGEGKNAIIPFDLSVNYTSDVQNCFAVDNIVNINLNTFNSNVFARDAWTIIATIPAGYRPSKVVYMSAYGSDGGWNSPVAVPVMINTSGEILVFLKTTVKRILISSSYLQ